MTRKLLRTAAIVFALLASALSAAAQTDAPPPADSTPRTPAPDARDSTAAARATADEDFELNITERHIAEESFEAATEVSVGGRDSRGVNVRVGVNARAERIDVWLRGVRGRVRFRGSLEQILRRLGARTPDAPAPSDAR